MIETFKKGTLESKVFFVFTFIVLIWCMLLLSSCSSGIYKLSKPVITHVLAVTEMGDTLKIPINEIRPNVIYNVLGYGYHRPYYHGQVFRPGFTMTSINDYYPYNYNYNNTNYSGSNYGIGTIKPTTQISTPSSGGSSGTSGGNGNPVAVNPVTSGGGAKKNN